MAYIIVQNSNQYRRNRSQIPRYDHSIAKLTLTLDSNDKIVYLSTAQNLLRSPKHHFTLYEIYQGVNANGDKLLEDDFVFEVEKQAQGLNEKSQMQIIIIPRE